MSEQQTKCPEPGCNKATTAWVSGLQSQAERDYEKSCPGHQGKYRRLRDEDRAAYERLKRYCS